MEQPNLQFVFEIRIDVAGGKLPELGKTAKGVRKIVSILSGRFEGPEIKGIILTGGYDWQLIRNDGVAEVEAHYVLKTDDDVLITITNKGLRHGTADAMQRIANGELVAPSEYYFRTSPVFETAADKYDWLNKNIFIANGIRTPDQVLIQVWKVL
ncbi:MAG TPA: DUF3237 domain-containing protein [Mucilaginibacter sp.]|jgi:hypothetical protein